MNLSANIDVSAIAVFIEGLLSFFSPCVLPLLPVYIGYLSGGTVKKDKDGKKYYDQKRVLINTIFFVIGISMAFFLLGFGMSTIGKFFNGNQLLFARIGGMIIILFGLYQLGILGESRLLNGEYRLPFNMERMTMSPITALLMGFVLSFAWSPCVGPVLSSVLILAASASSSASGFAMIGLYTLGYIIPFLFVGFFTSYLLDIFAKHRNIVKYTVKIGGVILIVMGLLMITGKMNSITGYLSKAVNNNISKSEAQVSENLASESSEEKEESDPSTVSEEVRVTEEESQDESAAEDDQELLPAPDFTLTDQCGESHSLADYKGKIIFLNFWATWCPPCKAELPYIQELYEEYQSMEDPDVVFLGVTFPNTGNEKDVEGIKAFMDENGYTFPVLMDTDASLMLPYYITAYPTTYLIDPEGNVLGYIPGGMTKDIMKDVIRQAREASK